MKNTQDVKNIIEQNKVLLFKNLEIVQQNESSYLISGIQHVTWVPKHDVYAINFMYTIKDIVANDDFYLFLKSIFKNVKITSSNFINGIELLHRAIIQNFEKLTVFTDNPLKDDSCKGNVSILIDKQTGELHSFIFSGLISASFEDHTSCFYNIQYSYANENDLCFVFARNMISKTLTAFSNNGFICLVSPKMSEVFSDVYADYTKDEIEQFKTLHNMISI